MRIAEALRSAPPSVSEEARRTEIVNIDCDGYCPYWKISVTTCVWPACKPQPKSQTDTINGKIIYWMEVQAPTNNNVNGTVLFNQEPADC